VGDSALAQQMRQTVSDRGGVVRTKKTVVVNVLRNFESLKTWSWFELRTISNRSKKMKNARGKRSKVLLPLFLSRVPKIPRKSQTVLLAIVACCMCLDFGRLAN
jgi:hypothetical protein